MGLQTPQNPFVFSRGLMARPEKHDVDYFPFYVKDGKTLFILESKYGCKGTGFFTNVMRFLCQTPDHHFCIKAPADRLYFFAKVKCDEESGIDMLNMMSETGKIHPKMWVSAAVIVSEALLESIQDAYRKRNNPIITLSEIRQKYVSDDHNRNSGDGNEINGGNKPQSKVKESKVNKNNNDFEKFYSGYPIKKSKNAALKAWQKEKPNLDICLKAIDLQKAEKQNLRDAGQFCPEWKHPATWINQHCWEDEPIKTEAEDERERFLRRHGAIE